MASGFLSGIVSIPGTPELWLLALSHVCHSCIQRLTLSGIMMPPVSISHPGIVVIVYRSRCIWRRLFFDFGCCEGVEVDQYWCYSEFCP